MKVAESATIPPELAGSRLDQALSRMFPQFSRSKLKRWIVDGQITVDGMARKPRDAVIGGEQVLVDAAEEPAVTSKPEVIPLDIVHEDEHLLVINKPAGLVVHPGAGNTHGTLMNGLLNHDAALSTLPRAGIVHRLDKDTSGLLMVARTQESVTVLTRRLADREIARRYVAIVNGVLTGGATIDAPIGRHPADRTRMAVRDGGRPAVTRFTVLKRFRAHTEVSVKLETGRTHQIRVHFAHRRHPLVGDPVYGGRLAIPAGASDALAGALRDFRRQALHATSLTLAHPLTDAPLTIECAPPADYQALSETLAADA